MRVPPPFLEGLTKLRDLPEPRARELVLAVQQATPRLFPPRLQADLRRQVSGIDQADLSDIIDALVGAAGAASDAENPDRFVEALAKSPDLAVPTDRTESFASLLHALIQSDALRITFKGFDLLWSNERVMRSGQVISDLRPVFDATGERPQAAVIIHNLQIDYWESGGSSKTFSVALDTRDVEKLSVVLERAKVKGATLQRMIEDLSLRYLPVDTDEE